MGEWTHGYLYNRIQKDARKSMTKSDQMSDCFVERLLSWAENFSAHPCKKKKKKNRQAATIQQGLSKCLLGWWCLKEK